MCFPSSASVPETTAAPAPSPTPTPEDTNPTQTAQQKRQKLAGLRYGAMSTVKTSGQGITGTGANLSTPAATAGQKTIG